TNDDVLYYVFHYHPSRSLAYVGVAVFAVLAVVLMQSIRKTKAPKSMMNTPVLAIMECVGFGLRVKAIDGDFGSVAVAMNVLLLIAPSLLSLANFSCMIHILKLSNLQNERFYYQPSIASKMLTACTITTSVLQGAGSGMISNSDTKNAGYAILIVGLVLQLLTYLAYIFILNYIHKNPKFDYHIQNCYNPKQRLVYLLYITTSAFIVRSVYRIIQYILVISGHPISLEWTFYIFDALMVAACLAVFIIIPCFLPRKDSQIATEQNNY
ncbi:RTA1 like protein-domain-containing protein, partial [Sporodiniella umbellata]